MNEKVALLGASRGLGAVFARKWFMHFPETRFFLSARKKELLDSLASEIGPLTQVLPCDFSKIEEQETCLNSMIDFAPDRILYFAGGGPYGEFASKAWKDHLWCWQVSFLFAARVLHRASLEMKSLKQITFIGSAIAEDRPDPKAASYASSKHALKGLILSVVEEKPKFDLRLYSPGYMDTDLLPNHAWPRQHSILDPDHVAQDLLSWLFVNDGTNWRVYR